MVGRIGRNDDIRIFPGFTDNLYFVQSYPFAFEVYEVYTVVMSRRIIELIKRRPSVARVFHLVRIDRTIGIGKASLCHGKRMGVFHFDRVATSLGRSRRPVQVGGFVEITYHENRSLFV